MPKDEVPRNTDEEGWKKDGEAPAGVVMKKGKYRPGRGWPKGREHAIERSRTPRSTSHEFEDAQLKCVPDCKC